MMKLLKPNGEIYPTEKLPANRALKGEKIVNDEAIIERLDGSRIIVSSTSAPLTDTNGEIIGSVAIFEDITEKRELEKKSICIWNIWKSLFQNKLYSLKR
jgi:PAS domain S-box-containing protein